MDLDFRSENSDLPLLAGAFARYSFFSMYSPLDSINPSDHRVRYALKHGPSNPCQQSKLVGKVSRAQSAFSPISGTSFSKSSDRYLGPWSTKVSSDPATVDKALIVRVYKRLSLFWLRPPTAFSMICACWFRNGFRHSAVRFFLLMPDQPVPTLTGRPRAQRLDVTLRFGLQ